jgi:hypothetical protein
MVLDSRLDLKARLHTIHQLVDSELRECRDLPAEALPKLDLGCFLKQFTGLVTASASV